MSAYKVIAANELNKSEGLIIDVRTPAEHTEKHLKRQHELVPLDQLNPSDVMIRRGLDKEAPVYLLCRSGMRARTAADKFTAAGYANVNVIDGGIIACELAGEAVEAKAAPAAAQPGTITIKMPSIEQQTQMAAGLLISVGSLLAMGVHVIFGLLPLAVGAGLMYAGFTKSCGMSMLLMKAPWNKGMSSSCATPKSACSVSKPADNSASKTGGCA